MAEPRRRDEALALLALAALAALLLRRAVFAGEALFERDLGFWYYSQAESIVRIVSSGSWPLWDPYMSFGIPLLANPSAQILYPFTPLHALFVPWTFYTLYVLCHLTFTGAGAYALARRLSLSAPASLLAGCAWMASGPLLSLVNMWHHFSGAAWIPWILYGAERACASRRVHDALLLAGLLAGQILAGSADMCVLAAGGALLLGLRHLRGPAKLAWLRTLALAGALAAGATAAQWLPSLELVRTAQRSALPEVVRTQWSVHPLALVGLAAPTMTKGLPLRGVDPRLAQETEIPLLYSLYLGVGVLLLAAAGLADAGWPPRRALALLIVGSVAIALGRFGGISEALVRLLPPLGIVRFPVKALVLLPLASALLAGRGLDAWRARAPLRALPIAGLLLLAACGGVAWLAAAGPEGPLPLRHEPWLPELLASNLRRSLLAALTAAAVLALAWGRSAAGVAGALALAELVLMHWFLNPTGPARLLAERPATVAAIAADGAKSPTRVYTFDYFWQVLGKKTPTPEVRGALDLTDVPGPPGWGRVLGLRMMYPASGRWGLGSSFDRDNLGLHSAHMRALVTLFRNAEETPAYARLLARAGVRYVLALHAEGLEDLDEIAAVASPFPLPIRVFRVRDPLPQAFVVGRGRLAVGEASLAALAGADFDPTREVLLEQGEALASDEFSGSVAIVTLLPDRLVADVQLSQPGYLVTTDGYDPGWKASVDGRPASLLRANVAFRAVPVPAGTHRVEQVYRPRSVSAGLAISGLALLAGVAIASRAARASLRR